LKEITRYFYTSSFENLNYVQFLINIIKFYWQANATRYKVSILWTPPVLAKHEVLFGLLPLLAKNKYSLEHNHFWLNQVFCRTQPLLAKTEYSFETQSLLVKHLSILWTHNHSWLNIIEYSLDLVTLDQILCLHKGMI